MTDDRPLVHCVIEELEDGAHGPGFYYTMIDRDGDEEQPIGPFATEAEAEAGFHAALELAAIDMIKTLLGLDA